MISGAYILEVLCFVFTRETSLICNTKTNRFDFLIWKFEKINVLIPLGPDYSINEVHENRLLYESSQLR